MSDRCPFCSFDPTNVNDFCSQHRGPALNVSRSRATQAPQWLKQALREAVRVSVNYGVRARCLEVLGQPPDLVPCEILEAREQGSDEAYIAMLRVLAPVFTDCEEELAFIEGRDEDDGAVETVQATPAAEGQDALQASASADRRSNREQAVQATRGDADRTETPEVAVSRSRAPQESDKCR